MTIGLGHYDRIDIQQDIADEGAELPQWHPLLSDIPATVTDQGGQQNLDGERQKAEGRFRVAMQVYEGLRIAPNMRVIVREGLNAGATLNIISVNYQRPTGLDTETWLQCEDAAA